MKIQHGPMLYPLFSNVSAIPLARTKSKIVLCDFCNEGVSSMSIESHISALLNLITNPTVQNMNEYLTGSKLNHPDNGTNQSFCHESDMGMSVPPVQCNDPCTIPSPSIVTQSSTAPKDTNTPSNYDNQPITLPESFIK